MGQTSSVTTATPPQASPSVGPGAWARQPRALLVLAAGLLALHGYLGISASLHKSATSDELAHLTAGYAYWTLDDFRLQPENGVFPQLWGAVPLLFMDDIQFPSRQQEAWRGADVWEIGFQFFYESGNDPDRMLLGGRSMIGLLSMALGAVVFAWSRRCFGEWGGLLTLFLYAVSPTLLAHGFLVTSDLALTLFLVLTAEALWQLFHRITPGRLAAGSASLGVLLAAKASGVLILPIAALLACARLLRAEPIAVRFGGRVLQLNSPGARLAGMAGALAACGLASAVILWGFYGFRYSGFSASEADAGRYFEPWEYVAGEPAGADAVLRFARDHRLLPESYLYGFAYVTEHARMRSAFLRGENSNVGWLHFFPYAFLIKTPLGTLLLALMGTTAILRQRDLVWRLAPLGVLLAVYWIVSLGTNLNIGHRHILPTYPVLFLVAGAAVLWSGGRLGRRTVVLLLLAWVAAASTWVRPHYLAYFNELIGGPRQGYRHLVDSSLDWGQDVPGLRDWLDQTGAMEGPEPVYLGYFGNGNPAHYGVRARRLPSYFPHRLTGDVPALEPGIYCISATQFQGIASPVKGPWTAEREAEYRSLLAAVDELASSAERLRQAHETLGREGWNRFLIRFDELRFARLCAFLEQGEPDHWIGYSILVFRLSEDELREAVLRPELSLEAAQ